MVDSSGLLTPLVKEVMATKVKKLNEEEKDKLVEMYQSTDKSVEKVGEEFGVSEVTASSILDERDVEKNKQKLDQYSKSDVCDALRSFYEENRRSPKSSEWDRTPSVWTVMKLFDSWDQALEEAGLPKPDRGYGMDQEYTDDELIDLLREYEKRPTAEDFNEDGSVPTAKTYAARFGSWSNALEKAGYKGDVRQKYSDVDIIQKMVKAYKLSDSSITVSKWKEEFSPPSPQTIIRRFGKWSEAWEKIEAEIEKRSNNHT